MTSGFDWSELDATGVAAAIRENTLTPEQALDCALGAIEAANPDLNAVVFPMADLARSSLAALPAGPFRGVPLVVKDLDGFTAGVPYTMSSRFLKDFVPKHDAEVIARLRRAGFVIVAKTNCPELGILGTTEPELRGPTRNPWNLGHSPGGSSGGSAALVAARAVPVGHGGDGGGSIRIPASACGLFGMKCSRGVLPLGPEAGEGWGGYVTPGVLTRSVRDSAAIYDFLAGSSPGDPYAAPRWERSLVQATESESPRLRVALCPESLFGRSTDSSCVAAVESAGRILESLGHRVELARPSFDRGVLVMAYLTQVAASVAMEVEDAERWAGRRASSAEFEPATWFLNQLGSLLSAQDLQRSRDAAQAAGRSLGAFFEQFDVLVTPTMAHPPPRLGETALKPVERLGLGVLRAVPMKSVMLGVLRDLAEKSLERVPNTQLFNMTGCPAMSVPLHWSAEGLPIGVQFASRLGADPLLIGLAAQLERAAPWSARRPPVRRASPS